MVQNLEFFVPEPELSFLKVCPSVVPLSPRQGARIEVSFCPPKALPEKGNLSRDEPHDATDAGNGDENQGGDAREAAAAAVPSRGLSGKDSNKKGQDKAKATTAAAAPSASNGKNPIAPNPSEAEAEQQPQPDKEDCTAEAAAEGTQAEGEDGNGLPLVPVYAGDLDEGGEHGDEDENEDGETQEPWSRHGRWRLPCFLKSAGVDSVGGNGAQGSGGERGRGHEALLPPLALEVRNPKLANLRKPQ